MKKEKKTKSLLLHIFCTVNCSGMHARKKKEMLWRTMSSKILEEFCHRNYSWTFDMNWHFSGCFKSTKANVVNKKESSNIMRGEGGKNFQHTFFIKKKNLKAKSQVEHILIKTSIILCIHLIMSIFKFHSFIWWQFMQCASSRSW